MALKFSELLDKQRLRPLWQRSVPDGTPPGSAAERNPDDAKDQESLAELGEPQLPVESPHAILTELEATLRSQLGTSSALLSHLFHPLRAAVAKVDPQAAAKLLHPMQKASVGNVHELIDRLEDALTSLLPRPGR